MMGKHGCQKLRDIECSVKKVDVRQFLDGKHNSKLSDTVSKVFTVNVIGAAVFPKVNVRQCFELVWVTIKK